MEALTLVPQKVALSGNRVFVNVIGQNEDVLESNGLLPQHNGCLYEKGECGHRRTPRNAHLDTRGKGCVKTLGEQTCAFSSLSGASVASKPPELQRVEKQAPPTRLGRNQRLDLRPLGSGL